MIIGGGSDYVTEENIEDVLCSESEVALAYFKWITSLVQWADIRK